MVWYSLFFIGCDFLNTGRFIKIAYPKTPRSLVVTTGTGTATGTGTGTTGDTSHDGGDNNHESRYTPSDLVGCRTVFLKNLPYDVSEKEIQETLQVCGPISTIRLAAWNHTRSQKGKFSSSMIESYYMIMCIYIYHNCSICENLCYHAFI